MAAINTAVFEVKFRKQTVHSPKIRGSGRFMKCFNRPVFDPFMFSGSFAIDLSGIRNKSH